MRIWLYLLYAELSSVEELLAERGLDVSYETVRCWVLKFGPVIARRLRRCRSRPSDRASATTARPDGLPLPAASERRDNLGQGLSRPALWGHVMSETPQLLLAHHLKALKLPTFLREYDKLAPRGGRRCNSLNLI